MHVIVFAASICIRAACYGILHKTSSNMDLQRCYTRMSRSMWWTWISQRFLFVTFLLSDYFPSWCLFIILIESTCIAQHLVSGIFATILMLRWRMKETTMCWFNRQVTGCWDNGIEYARGMKLHHHTKLQFSFRMWKIYCSRNSKENLLKMWSVIPVSSWCSSFHPVSLQCVYCCFYICLLNMLSHSHTVFYLYS